MSAYIFYVQDTMYTRENQGQCKVRGKLPKGSVDGMTGGVSKLALAKPHVRQSQATTGRPLSRAAA